MKTCSVCYLPPKSVPGALAFWENLQKFPAKGDVILYSDSDYPGAVKLRGNPENFKHDKPEGTFYEGANAGRPNVFAMHNAIFLTGVKIAREQGYTHMLYLEADCRVGRRHWDQVIFDEYFSLGRPTIVAGTLAIYNPTNWGLATALAAQRLTSKLPKHGIPIGVYGWSPDRGGWGANEKAPCVVFPNGALAIYDMAWLTKRLFTFDSLDPMSLSIQARQNTAFDLAIGQNLFTQFDVDAFEVVGQLESVYSGYGDVFTTPEIRRQLLLDGKVVAMHQEKGDWQP